MMFGFVTQVYEFPNWTSKFYLLVLHCLLYVSSNFFSLYKSIY